MENINVMVIGVGFHARRIYIPTLMKLSKSMPIRLVGGVDVKTEKTSIDSYLSKKEYKLEMLYFEPFDSTRSLPSKCIAALDSFVKDFDIKGVVISTEPLLHKEYAAWALKRNLNILMDKPISVRKSVTSKVSQAVGIIKDYRDLLNLYKKTQLTKSTIFSINVQRRYEYGFEKVKELIAEVRDKFNMPVTSIQAMHADGTWVFPKEILFQKNHPYLDGYGKSSHSGYHLFDIVWQLYEAGMIKEKCPNSMEVFSSFLSPAGFNLDFSEKDYYQHFGSEYTPTNLSENQYKNKVDKYGEIDCFSVVRLLKDKENICNISINLLHSSFSRRAWATPNSDLYKGNGRVKHQSLIIQQGPFQCIQIHNYQSKDQHDVDNSDEFEVGGNNHFDIYVFRNNKMFGDGIPFYKISGKDLEKELSNQLVFEKAKERVILEFVNFLLGKIKKEDLLSNIDTHLIPVKIMSGVYQSNVQRSKGKNPLVKLPF